jgi:hypothetical protein
LQVFISADVSTASVLCCCQQVHHASTHGEITAMSLVLLYLSVVNTSIAVLYNARCGEWVIGKDVRTGQIPWWSYLVWGGYFLPTWLHTWGQTLVSKKSGTPVASEVVEGWWIGKPTEHSPSHPAPLTACVACHAAGLCRRQVRLRTRQAVGRRSGPDVRIPGRLSRTNKTLQVHPMLGRHASVRRDDRGGGAVLRGCARGRRRPRPLRARPWPLDDVHGRSPDESPAVPRLATCVRGVQAPPAGRGAEPRDAPCADRVGACVRGARAGRDRTRPFTH